MIMHVYVNENRLYINVYKYNEKTVLYMFTLFILLKTHTDLRKW